MEKKSEEVIIEDLFMNGQKVELKNPGGKGLPHFLRLARSMSKMPEDKPEAFMEYMDDVAIDASAALIKLSLEKTFGEITEEVDAWGMENAVLILSKVVEMCSPKQTRDGDKRKELSEKIKTLSGK